MKLARSALALASILAIAGPAGPARAAVTATIVEFAGDVVITGSGTLNTTSGVFSGSFPGDSILHATSNIGIGVPGTYDAYALAITGPSSFGPGVVVNFPATSAAGDLFGINFMPGQSGVGVPVGYVSGSPLSGSSTHAGQSFASMGLNPGVYTWEWGSGPSFDSFTLTIDGAPQISEIINFGDGINGPDGVAADASGNVFVAARATGNVFRITPGGVKSEIINSLDGISVPQGVAADASGNVFVAGAGSDNVFRITPGGVKSEIINLGDGLDGPVEVKVDASGNVFVTGSSSQNVFRITPGGVKSEIINFSDGLSSPFGVAVDASGNVFVAGFNSDNVFRITPGGVKSEIINLGDGLDGPLGVAVDASGNVFVAGFVSNNVYRITPGGVKSEIINLGDGLDGPRGVAVDASGNVFVTGNASDNVFRITPGGVKSEIINFSDGLEYPLGSQGVAVDASGNVFVSGYFSNNVYRITFGDYDGDGVPDVSDAFPLDPLEAFDTDGDGTGNNADLDDDGDGLPDTVETGTGFYVSPSNTGTFSLIADSDGDGLLDGADLAPLDGADCRALNPQLRLVWGRDAPFGVDHQNDPGIGHRYVLDAAASLPGLASDDLRFPSSLPESLRSGLQALFDGARADYPALPATTNGLQIETLTAADPLPPQGTPGSPSLLYIIDRSALEDPVTDPDFGPLEGFAFSGVNRFNKSCTGEAGSVFIDAGTVPLLTDPGYPQYLADLVETVAHEAGHLYGLRHVLPDGLAACTGDPAVPGPTPAVMDYTPDGANTQLAHCTGTPGQGCPVIEPPDCSGEDTGEDHNPLYHYLRYVVGDSTADLAGVGIVPGAWDADSVPLVAWKIEFGFFCISCNNPNLPFYNFTLVEILPGGIEVVRAVFSEITLGEINGDPGALPDPIPPLTLLLAQSSGLKLRASSVEPVVGQEDPPMDIVFAAPLYPPASQSDTSILVAPNLVKIVEPTPGTFTSELLDAGTAVETSPVYLIQSGGLADPSDGIYQVPADGSPVGAEDQLTESTYSCTDCFPAMTIADAHPDVLAQAVPEPGFGAGLAAGLAGLLALARRRGRAGSQP